MFRLTAIIVGSAKYPLDIKVETQKHKKTFVKGNDLSLLKTYLHVKNKFSVPPSLS